MRRDDSHRNQYKTYWCRNLQRWPDVQKAQRRASPATRRTLAAIAIAALMIGGAKIASDQTMPGNGFSTVQTAAAEPTGAPGPTGGMTDGGGSQFQAPQIPSSMPDYQGGNQPPMNQDNGISIYQTGAQGTPQQGGQSGGQQPQEGAQQPQHGTQIPDYSTAPGYTQGPGKPNPDYSGPQQNSPQQGQQPQQGNQNQQPQTQAPTQTQAPSQTQQPTQTQQSQTPTSERPSEDEKQRNECKSVSGTSFSDYETGKIVKAPAPECGDCDQEVKKQQNNCTKDYVLSVVLKGADATEGTMDSIHVEPTNLARVAGALSSAIAVVDHPADLDKFPTRLLKAAPDASQMWDEITCQALASDISQGADNQQLFNTILNNEASVFQQFLCHFLGASKIEPRKPTWNLEPARPAVGTIGAMYASCNVPVGG